MATFDVLASGVAGSDQPTSANSAYPHPVPAPWYRALRAGPTPRQRPTSLPAAATEPHVYSATPQIAAATALHRPDQALFPVPCRWASRPLGTPYQLPLTTVTHACRKLTTLCVVVSAPGRDPRASVEQIPEPVHVQAFVAEPTVKAFDVSVLSRLARLNVHRVDLP